VQDQDEDYRIPLRLHGSQPRERKEESSGALALDFSGSGGRHVDTGSRFFGGAEGAIAISRAFLFLNDNVGPYVSIFSVL